MGLCYFSLFLFTCKDYCKQIPFLGELVKTVLRFSEVFRKKVNNWVLNFNF